MKNSERLRNAVGDLICLLGYERTPFEGKEHDEFIEQLLRLGGFDRGTRLHTLEIKPVLVDIITRCPFCHRDIKSYMVTKKGLKPYCPGCWDVEKQEIKSCQCKHCTELRK